MPFRQNTVASATDMNDLFSILNEMKNKMDTISDMSVIPKLKTGEPKQPSF